jgi:hypothetical protein
MVVLMCAASTADQHTEVAMRLIGHKVMQKIGDSKSVVLPIKKVDNQYQISFSIDFEFEPSVLSRVIDSVMQVSEVSEKYIVEFVSCDSDIVMNSYEVLVWDTLSACAGRLYPKDCYKLFITLLDENSQGQSAAMFSTRNLLWVLLLLTIIGVGYYFFGRLKPTLEIADIEPLDPNIHQLGMFNFDTKNLELVTEESKIELTGKEAQLLELLHASANQTVERETILKAVWGDEGDYVGRTLDVFISKLRKKLEADSSVRIMSIRGVGYKLVIN